MSNMTQTSVEPFRHAMDALAYFTAAWELVGREASYPHDHADRLAYCIRRCRAARAREERRIGQKIDWMPLPGDAE